MRALFSAVIALVLTFSNAVSAQNVHTDYWDGQIYLKLVKYPDLGGFQENVPLSEAEFLDPNTIDTYGIQRLRKPFYRAKTTDVSHIYQLYFSESQKIEALIKELEALPFVEYAEAVPIMRPTLTPNDIGPASGSGDQWFLYNIQAENAWNLSVGSSNIIVAIVDDAVKVDHPDLAPALWTNPGEIPNNNIDDDNNGYVDDVSGFDVADNDNNPMPHVSNQSHGTHVAGCAGAATDNNIGVASIGWGISLLPVRSSNQVQTITDGYSGVIYAADAGAHVINMSWGGTGGGQTGQNIIDYARNAGSIPVAAAGNNNSTSVFYPAGYNGVITVAATSTSDQKASFSNYGSWIDISSPGTGIRATYIGSNMSNTYADLQGTSMASPIVAGLCGLMLSLNPNMTQQEVENCLYSTADPVTSNQNQMGAGRINAFAAMQCVAASINTPPVSDIGSDASQACPGGSIQFFGSSTAGIANSYSWTFQGGTPATSTAQNPVVSYPAAGNYDVSLITTNSFGADTLVLNGYASIGSNATEVIFIETFESSSPTQQSWSVSNPDNDVTWSLFQTSGNISGTTSAGIRLFTYDNAGGERDYLISPQLDFSNNTQIEMSFSHAHRRYSQSYSDSLRISVSTDGGTTWNVEFADAESGQGTFATNSITTSEFFPSTATDWCFGGNVGASCFTLDLSAYDGAPNVRIAFETVNDYGNNMFIDDVEIRGICGALPGGVTADFNYNDNTICEGETVQFSDNSQNAVSWSWTFQGGSPASSIQQNPSITYNNAGNYDVTLVATGSGGATDTYSESNAITVSPTPLASVSLSNGQLTASPSGMSYQWYFNGNAIPGATSSTYTPTAGGNYSVEVTSPAGCTRMSPAFNFTLTLAGQSGASLVVYPNPSSELVHVSLEGVAYDELKVMLMDQVGRLIKTEMSSSSDALSIHVNELATGTYYLRIYTDGQWQATEKIQVVH